MILPDKNIKPEYSLFNCGAILLRELSKPQTVSLLWDKVRKNRIFTNYEKYLLTLDYLFLIGSVSLTDGLIMRCKDDSLNKKQ